MAFLAQLDGFDTRSLDLLQRILPVSDGTLTDTLEAAFLDPITLVKLAIGILPATAPISLLDLDAGTMVMGRKILLRAKRSDFNLVYAESLLALDRLPQRYRERLIASDLPIGRLWTELRLIIQMPVCSEVRR